jgi:hypothetical protein
MGRKTVSCNGVEVTRPSSEERPRRARRHERRRPDGRFGAKGDSPLGGKHLDRPQLPCLVCLLAGRREIQLAAALEGCHWSIGKCAAPCLLVLNTVADVTVIAHGRQRTTRHGSEHGHNAMRVYAATCTPSHGERLSRSTTRAGRDLAEFHPQSASPRRCPAITCRQHMTPDVARSQRQQQHQGH